MGAGVALGAAEFRNRGLEPRFEAVAPVAVLRLPDEADETYSRRLDTVVAQARSAAGAGLADERLTIASDPSLGIVRFVAAAPSSDGALSAATELRATYLATRPPDTAEDQLAPMLDAIAIEIAEVEDDLAKLAGVHVDPTVEAQRSALFSQLQESAAQVVILEARLLNPALTEEMRTETEAELATAQAVLDSIGPRMEALPTSSDSISDTRNRLEALVLEKQLNDLESQYVSAALRRAEGGVQGLVGEPFVVDLSSEPLSPLIALLAGLAAGSLLGGVAVAVSDRLSLPVRTLDDVAGMALLPVTRRSRKLAGALDWYQAAATEDVRRSQIQALRSRLDRFLAEWNVVIVAGVGAPIREVTTLSADLAASIAATGRTVLFIDTRVANDPRDAVWDQAGPSLAEMLRIHDGNLPDRSVIKRLLSDRSEVAPNLTVVPAGLLDQDPIDALAGIGFAMVVEEARELVDIVVLSSGDTSHPASEAIVGRARLAVLVAGKDHTRSDDLTQAAANMSQLGLTVGASVLLVGRSAGSPQGQPRKPPTNPARKKQGRAARHIKAE